MEGKNNKNNNNNNDYVNYNNKTLEGNERNNKCKSKSPIEILQMQARDLEIRCPIAARSDKFTVDISVIVHQYVFGDSSWRVTSKWTPMNFV